MKTLSASLAFLLLATHAAAQTPEPPPEATPAPSPSPTEQVEKVEEEPRDLEAEIDALRADLDRLREEIIAPSGEGERDGNGLRTSDLAMRAPGIARLGGVATAAAVLAPDEGSEFVFPRAALFVFAPVGERVSFAAELAVLGGGAERIDADAGAPFRGDVYLQYAAADLVVVPQSLTLRGGLIAVPVGRANLASDESARELLVRSAESLYLIPTPWYDVGGGALGAVYLGSARLEWQAYVLSGPSSAIDARTGLRNSRVPPGGDGNADKALSARVMLSPIPALSIGVSGYSGAYSAGGGRRLALGEADVALDAGSLLLEATAVYARTDGGSGALGSPMPERMWGGSTQATLRLLPDAVGAVLPAAWQDASLGATVRYSLVDTDLDEPDSATVSDDPLAYTRRDRLAVGLSVRPVEGYVLRAEYEFRAEAGGSFADDDRAVFSATASF